jgi:cell division protein FtsB
VTNRKRRQSIISLPKVVAVATLTLVAILSIDFGRKALDNYRNQRQVEWLRQQVASELATNEELSARRDYVSSDDYVERISRERLKLTRPGETSVVVVLEDAEAPSAAQEGAAGASAQGESAPYWQQWADLLLGSEN